MSVFQPGIFQPDVFQAGAAGSAGGSGGLTIGSPTVGGTGTATAPSATGSGGLTIGGPIVGGAGAAAALSASGAGGLAIAGPGVAGTGGTTAPGAGGSGGLVIGSPAIAGVGSAAPPGASGAGGITIGRPTIAGFGGATASAGPTLPVLAGLRLVRATQAHARLARPTVPQLHLARPVVATLTLDGKDRRRLMAGEHILVGEEAQARVRFSAPDGSSVAATGVQIRARTPGGALMTYAVAPTGTAEWEATILFSEPGRWWVAAECTGPSRAVTELVIDVRARAVT